MGYIIELDPCDKTKAVKKRTALGRFAHESAAYSIPVPGQPLAVYMGDDSAAGARCGQPARLHRHEG